MDLKYKAESFAHGREGSVSLPLKLLAAVFGMAVLGALIYNSYTKANYAIEEVNRSTTDFISTIGSP